jgi:hypothetical protein
MLLDRNRKYEDSFIFQYDLLKSRWNLHQRAERGETVSSIIKKNGNIDEIIYSMKSGNHKIGLYFIALNEACKPLNRKALTEISLKLDDVLLEIDYQEGYLDIKNYVPHSINSAKRKYGLNQVEKRLKAKIIQSQVLPLIKSITVEQNYEPTISIVTPSVDSILTLKKCLETRIKALKDFAEQEKVLFSPISVPLKEHIMTPFLITSFNPFNSKEDENSFLRWNYLDEVQMDRFTWYGMTQAARNSVCPEDYHFCEDYITYCKWQDTLRQNARLSRTNDSISLGYVFPDFKNQRSIFKRSIENESSNALLVYHPEMLPHLVNYNVVSEENFGSGLFSHAKTYPPSIDEIIALATLDESICQEVVNRRIVGNKFSLRPVWFNSLGLTHELYSRIVDEDPRIIKIEEKVIDDLGIFTSDTVEHIMMKLGREDELLQKLVKDGYAQETTVSRYWSTLMKDLKSSLSSVNAPNNIVEIVENELGVKYGTRRLRKELEKSSYDEVIQKAWENLYTGKRWIL